MFCCTLPVMTCVLEYLSDALTSVACEIISDDDSDGGGECESNKPYGVAVAEVQG